MYCPITSAAVPGAKQCYEEACKFWHKEQCLMKLALLKYLEEVLKDGSNMDGG